MSDQGEWTIPVEPQFDWLVAQPPCLLPFPFSERALASS